MKLYSCQDCHTVVANTDDQYWSDPQRCDALGLTEHGVSKCNGRLIELRMIIGDKGKIQLTTLDD